MIESQERPPEAAPPPPDLADRVRAHPLYRRLVAFGVFFRDRLHEPARSHPVFGFPYRVFVSVVGVLVVIVGLIMVPAPGPGWLVVIAGLGILSTEFTWARRLLHFTRDKVAAWTRWVLRQPLVVRAAFGALGFLLLVGTMLLSLRLSGWTGFPFG